MPDFPDLSGMLAKVSSVKLSGGVVGKTATVLIAVCFAVTVISWSVHVWWISLIALVGILGLCYRIINRLIDFADKNPQAALLESAEFLAHEQMKFGTKETPSLPTTPTQSPTVQLEDHQADPEKQV